MIQLKVTGISTDEDVAKVTEQLDNIGALNEIMVTLTGDSAATIVVTGKADDDVLEDAVKQAGSSYELTEIMRHGIDPYNRDR